MRDLPKWRNEEGKTAERREISRRGGEGKEERGRGRKEKHRREQESRG
jgi:hypothetical protein